MEIELIRVLISKTFADKQAKCKLERDSTKALLSEFAGAVQSGYFFIFLLTRHQYFLIRFIHLPFMLSLLTSLLDQTADGYYSPWNLFTHHLGNITLTLYQCEAAGQYIRPGNMF